MVIDISVIQHSYIFSTFVVDFFYPFKAFYGIKLFTVGDAFCTLFFTAGDPYAKSIFLPRIRFAPRPMMKPPVRDIDKTVLTM